MAATTNIVTGATLATALVIGGIALSPEDAGVASDGGVADAGQQPPLVGNFYLRFPDEQSFLDAAKQAGFWRPIMRQERVCDRWGKDYIDGGIIDAGCIDYGTQLVPADAGEVDLANMGHAFDILGVVTVPRRDGDGGILPDGGSETLDGWHVNFSGVLPDAWKDYIVTPDNPVRRMR